MSDDQHSNSDTNTSMEKPTEKKGGLFGVFRRKAEVADDVAASSQAISPVELDNNSTSGSNGDHATAQPTPADKPKISFRERMRRALSRTGSGLGTLLLGRKAIDGDLLDELETLLLMADVGVEATSEIIATLTEQVNRSELKDSSALQAALQQILQNILLPCQQPLNCQTADNTPYILLVVGVNGVGKTTTIGKLAKRLQNEGKSVMLAAGDTFRAAAVEQLQVWGERNNVAVVAQHTGADSASVIFDAIQSAQAKNIDVIIADTAGRLHNKSHLMEELKKVQRVITKLDDSAPHEVLLVLDAGTGQNALSQMQQFNDAVNVTGIALTKLDGTAKGGIAFALSRKFGVPIRFVGVGESVDDLQPFMADEFVSALLGNDSID